MQKRRQPAKIILTLAAAFLALGLLAAGLQWLDQAGKKTETRGDLQARYKDEQITLHGKTYRLKSNLNVILFLGIDQTATDTEDYHSGGNADFLRLVVIDNAGKTVSQIQIDRDTMAPVTVLNLIGQRTDIQPMQIAVSHSYGDGKEMSCELTVEAVRKLLLDVPIQSYIALNLDGITALNDFVDGVPVPIDDDFSAVDPSLVQGTTVRLTGSQAETFVRSRSQMPVGTNEARMARQQTYLERLWEIIDDKLQDDSEYIGALFDAAAPYLTANLTRSQIVSTAWRIRGYQQEPLIIIPGARQIGATGYMEFTPDAQALEKIVLDVFYREAKQ